MEKIIHDKSVNIEVLAKGTPGIFLYFIVFCYKYLCFYLGFTGADIESMVNQAALKAATEGCKRVGMHHLDEAKDRVLMGPARLKGRYPDEETVIFINILLNLKLFLEQNDCLSRSWSYTCCSLHKKCYSFA